MLALCFVKTGRRHFMYLLKVVSIQNWLVMVTVMMKLTIFIATLMGVTVAILVSVKHFAKIVYVLLEILVKKSIIH